MWWKSLQGHPECSRRSNGTASLLSDRQRGWVQDILDNASAIKRHLDHLTHNDLDTFRNNELVVDAVERCLSRISEAAVKLGEGADEEVPGVPWDEIRGLGNLLRHAYHTVDLGVVWEILVEDLYPLEEACRRALATEEG
jgi:uncharacterized protein with HEPN domain